MPYFYDDGAEFNPDLIPKSSKCVTCKKNGDPKYEIPCNLTRGDQDKDIFICLDYCKNLSRKLEFFSCASKKRFFEHSYCFISFICNH